VMSNMTRQGKRRASGVTAICVTERPIERCRALTPAEDLAALSEGTLSIERRFRLARHIRRCLTCKLVLLIMLDEVERRGGPGKDGIKAVAVLTDVDTQKMSDWLIAMFCGSRCNGDDE
jgi:hypothetical protein